MAYDGDGNRIFQLNYNLHTDDDWKGNSEMGTETIRTTPEAATTAMETAIRRAPRQPSQNSLPVKSRKRGNSVPA